MDITEHNTYIVAGYEFESERDAKEAEREQHNIMALKSKIDFHNTNDMVKLYVRLIEKQVFHTPVGIQFLSEFREYLIGEAGQEEAGIPAVKVERRQGMTRLQREKLEFLEEENKKNAARRKYYFITIGALIVVIVTMFIITALNPNVGYINTENKILNRYAEWEEQLSEREKQLNDREAELNSKDSGASDAIE